ncbi:DUF4197 domain-containing protein [Terricaulis silvestris]|uniref:DUF4197 domain-containing protein n=1 Tax=Terricaulis silvestris TaxID=2686094 RepID=A0A6I6MHE9_9CAUL|nr:DUF4197 domain-containing protein [Terricaulis silvestris]QGZ94270.1 hypothetical protein DSM104635_01086 [Terricaulis silvestris]
MQNHFARRALIVGLLASAASPTFAQQPLLDSLTQTDARTGIRDALGLAALNATTRLAQPDAFWSNARVRIPLPGVLGQTQRTLSGIGMSAPLDQLQESLNHAAERTMPEAGRLFSNAVRTVTIADAIEIVRGGNDSATRYLRGRTETRLMSLLRPAMTEALTQSGAFTLLRSGLREVGLASMTRDLRGEVINFSTTKALDGCFYFIAEEERAIRRDPWRRTTDILRRVFG